jgi:hypothetical protein
MKNRIRYLWIAALIAAIALSFTALSVTGCDSGNSNENGGGGEGGGGNVAVTEADIADFGSGASITKTFNVGSEAEWDAALSSIANGGNDKNYIINITAGFSIEGGGILYPYFGSVSGVKVSLRGEGKTLSLSGSRYLLFIKSGQTVILRGLALRKSGSVNYSLVCVAGGTFIMQSGEIAGNDVHVSSGIFTMNGGKISGSGVFGVLVSNGTFTMNSGEISGNSSGVYGGQTVSKVI